MKFIAITELRSSTPIVAQTLRERFDPKCGGGKHGTTTGLSVPQVDDLVAYLQTL